MNIKLLLFPLIIELTKNIKNKISIDFFELRYNYLYNEIYYSKLVNY